MTPANPQTLIGAVLVNGFMNAPIAAVHVNRKVVARIARTDHAEGRGGVRADNAVDFPKEIFVVEVIIQNISRGYASFNIRVILLEFISVDEIFFADLANRAFSDVELIIEKFVTFHVFDFVETNSLVSGIFRHYGENERVVFRNRT